MYSRALSLSRYYDAELTVDQRQLAAEVNAKLAAEVTALGDDLRSTDPVYVTADGGFAQVEVDAGKIAIDNGFVKVAAKLRPFRAKLEFKKVEVSEAAVRALGVRRRRSPPGNFEPRRLLER